MSCGCVWVLCFLDGLLPPPPRLNGGLFSLNPPQKNHAERWCQPVWCMRKPFYTPTWCQPTTYSLTTNPFHDTTRRHMRNNCSMTLVGARDAEPSTEIAIFTRFSCQKMKMLVSAGNGNFDARLGPPKTTDNGFAKNMQCSQKNQLELTKRGR